MEQITEKFIEEQVKYSRCPDSYHCVYRAMGSDPASKERQCTGCWARFCKDNGMNIVKEIR